VCGIAELRRFLGYRIRLAGSPARRAAATSNCCWR
jgi:hypothetical protein